MPKGKNKKVIGLIKDVLGGKIKTKFDWLRAESYSNLIDNGSKDKKEKDKKKMCHKKLKFQNYKNCIEEIQDILSIKILT